MSASPRTLLLENESEHPLLAECDPPRADGERLPFRKGNRPSAGNHKVGQWVESLRRSDVERLWAELHRVVSGHQLVRASRRAGLLREEGAGSAYGELTQELFLVLLSKSRFQHYLDAGMTNAEIEREIGQIELTNLLTGELRKRHPESYRLARRISTVVLASSRFRRFDAADEGDNEKPHRRLTARLYGLSGWADGKARRAPHDIERRIQTLPVRPRDRRLVGCSGDAHLIISNPELEGLIAAVFEAADSPVDVRTLRSLVMSRLPVLDIYMVPLEGDDPEGWGERFEPVDARENPEQRLLRREAEGNVRGRVDQFIEELRGMVGGKAKQFNRILRILWYCYLGPEQLTQLKVSKMLGVSDTLVSDYRRRIERGLRRLSFTGIEDARRFETELRGRVTAHVTTKANEH